MIDNVILQIYVTLFFTLVICHDIWLSDTKKLISKKIEVKIGRFAPIIIVGFFASFLFILTFHSLILRYYIYLLFSYLLLAYATFMTLKKTAAF